MTINIEDRTNTQDTQFILTLTKEELHLLYQLVEGVNSSWFRLNDETITLLQFKIGSLENDNKY